MQGQTVLLVGAGASVAEAGPARIRRAPPLDASFFQLCRRARLVRDTAVQDYLVANYGFNPFSAESRMEEVFNLLYSDVTSNPPPNGAIDAYWSLLTLYRRAISRTTNELSGSSRSGVGSLYRFLLRTFPNCRISFVTFNHDLLIEKALQLASETRRYQHISWNLRSAYGLRFARWPKPRGSRGSFSLHSEKSADGVHILKLHGSMNWLYPVSNLDDPKNAFRIPRGDLMCSNDSNIYPTYEISQREGYKDLVPLVVPPVYEKSEHISRVLSPVWNSAAELIRSARNLIVFGYSMPDADLAARSMLRRALYQGRELQHVHVIDVNPFVGSKISSILNVATISQYRTVSDFCRVHSAA
jgi:hypothetical protein